MRWNLGKLWNWTRTCFQMRLLDSWASCYFLMLGTGEEPIADMCTDIGRFWFCIDPRRMGYAHLHSFRVYSWLWGQCELDMLSCGGSELSLRMEFRSVEAENKALQLGKISRQVSNIVLASDKVSLPSQLFIYKWEVAWALNILPTYLHDTKELADVHNVSFYGYFIRYGACPDHKKLRRVLSRGWKESCVQDCCWW